MKEWDIIWHLLKYMTEIKRRSEKDEKYEIIEWSLTELSDHLHVGTKKMKDLLLKMSSLDEPLIIWIGVKQETWTLMPVGEILYDSFDDAWDNSLKCYWELFESEFEITEYQFDKLNVSDFYEYLDDFGTEKSSPRINIMKLAEKLMEICPLHYDVSKNWWIWDWKKCAWRMIDDTDVFVLVKEYLDWMGMIKGIFRNEILFACTVLGRKNVPLPAKSTWIQFKNIIKDVKTGETMIPIKDYFFTNPLPFKLGNSEDTPTIDMLFSQWVRTEEEKQLLYEIIAYCMLPDYPIHRLFCFLGAGRNGKTSYMKLVGRFIGEYNCTSTDIDRIFDSRFESSKLYKKLMATVGETNFNVLKSTSYLKRLTGQDFVSMEFKNKEPFDAKNYAKILISTNSLPLTEDKTVGFYSRWIIVDFPNTFDFGRDIIEDIPEYEFENLAKKCLGILRTLLKNGKFTYEKTIEEKERIYEEKSNPISKFMQLRCDKDVNGTIPLWEFHEELTNYLIEAKARQLSKKEVSRWLRNEGFEVKLSRIDENVWRCVFGLGWKDAKTSVPERIRRDGPEEESSLYDF